MAEGNDVLNLKVEMKNVTRITWLSVGLLLLTAHSSFGQRNVRDSTQATTHLGLGFGGYMPALDLADRFGESLKVGATLSRKMKSNWYTGLNFAYFFGNDVTEPGLLQNLLTDEGTIVDNQGQIAEINVGMRGYYIGVEAGRLFPVVGPNPNCGILAKVGLGYLHHKIRLEHQFHEVTQLEDPYLQGYDRLTNGFGANQFIGYFHMSSNRLVNFYAGLECIQGWTKGRRELNFDTLETDDQLRTDMLIGLRLGWVLHFYRRESDVYYH